MQSFSAIIALGILFFAQATIASSTTSRQGIQNLIDSKDFTSLFTECDTMARQVIRAVFHDATSKSIKLNWKGAVDGSIQYELTMNQPNRLIADVVTEIQNFKSESVSFSDALVLASVFAVRICKGPAIPFYFGRIDSPTAGPPNLLFEESTMDQAQMDRVADMGLTMPELITLVAGGHSVATTQGESPFDATPESLDTVFVEELLGPRSIHDLERVRLGSDMSIASDNEMGRPMFQSFVKDPKMFHAKFAQAFLKLCNLGWEGKLEKF